MDLESKQYHLGSPFPLTAKGLAFLFGMAGLSLMLFSGFDPVLTAIGSGFLLFFLVIIFGRTRVYLEPDQAMYKRVFRVFGIEIGGWREIKTSKGLIIRNVQLSDKMQTGSTIGLLPTMGTYRSILTRYETEREYDQVWLVETAINNKDRQLLLASGRQRDAFDFVNSMVDRCGLEVYLGHYLKDRKLNREQLKENKLVFQKKPDVLKRRR